VALLPPLPLTWNCADARTHNLRAAAPVKSQQLVQDQRFTVPAFAYSPPSTDPAVDREQAFQSIPRPSFWTLPGWRPHDHDMPTKLHHGLHRVVHPPTPLLISQSRQPPSLLTFVTVPVSPSPNPLKRYSGYTRGRQHQAAKKASSSLINARASGGTPRNHFVPKLMLKTRLAKHRRLIFGQESNSLSTPWTMPDLDGFHPPHLLSPLLAPLGSNSARRVRGRSRVLRWKTTPRWHHLCLKSLHGRSSSMPAHVLLMNRHRHLWGTTQEIVETQHLTR
jgi:hypothetical protein